MFNFASFDFDWDNELQTIDALHSSTLEIFLLAIEKQMDIEQKNADSNHFIASAVDAALVRLYNNVRCAQISAIERETGA
jgi:hypothetical protein